MKQAEDQSLASQLADSGLLWNLAIFFGLGLLLVFTPCVLPMIPILSAVIVGSEAGRGRAFLTLAGVRYRHGHNLRPSGVAAALAGANLQAILQTPLFIAPSGSHLRIAGTYPCSGFTSCNYPRLSATVWTE